MSDENGEITWSAEYKAWGEAQVVISEAAKTAGINNPIRFQGQYFDEESGLHYNRHRYYDPEIGRFISSDPIGLMGGFNTHAYAPNPTEWVDPLGLAKNCCNPCGIAPYKDQPSPRRPKDAHHIVQDEWAKANNIEGYSSRNAPSILLNRSPEHSTITTRQNARRDARVSNGQGKWSTSAKDELNNSAGDLKAAGVSERCRRKALKDSYKYLDNLGAIK